MFRCFFAGYRNLNGPRGWIFGFDFGKKIFQQCAEIKRSFKTNHMAKEEGIKIIASIVNQIKGNSYNVYREEFDTVDGEYFSISVNEDLANVKD